MNGNVPVSVLIIGFCLAVSGCTRAPSEAPAPASRSDLDKTSAARGVDIANIAADKAVVAARQLDLDYTKVRAPVSGRVSRYVVTVGNLIQSGDQNGGTLLTTIVSVDPMYAYFDVDEHTVLRVRKLIREGKADSPRETDDVPVWLGLANEEGHPHKGRINFVDNYQNEVVSRPVRLGALHDVLREITDGLNPGERVIVNGLQQVRPGLTVEPKLVDMPTSEPR